MNTQIHINTPPPITPVTYKAVSQDNTQDDRRDLRDLVKQDVAGVPMLTRNKQRIKPDDPHAKQGPSTMTTYLIGMFAPAYLLNPLVNKLFFNNTPDINNNRMSSVIKWFDHYSPKFDAQYKPFFAKQVAKFNTFLSRHIHPDNLKLLKTGFNEGWMFTAKRENLLERKIKERHKVLEKLEKTTSSLGRKNLLRQEQKLSSKIAHNTELILTNRKNLEEAYQRVGNHAPGRTSFPSLIQDLREHEKKFVDELNKKYPLYEKHFPHLTKKMQKFVQQDGHIDINFVENFLKQHPQIADFRGDTVAKDFASRINRHDSALIKTFKKVQTQDRILKTFEKGLKMGSMGKISTRVFMTVKRNMTGILGIMQGVFIASSIADFIHARKSEKLKFAGEDILGNWIIGWGSWFLMDWIGKGIIKVGKGEAPLMNLLRGTNIPLNTTASKNTLTPVMPHQGAFAKTAKVIANIRASHVLVPVLGSFVLGTLGVKLAHFLFGKPITDEDLKQDKISGFLEDIGVKQ